MNRRMAVVLMAGLIAACADTGVNGPSEGPVFDRVAQAGAGHVYTMTNATGGNEVVHFARAADGSLSEVARYATGGNGTGGGLGNQGGLVFGRGGAMLVVVNAGSNDVSAFRRNSDGSLTLVNVAPSGGTMPISATADFNVVYVLNAGGDGNISGFVLRPTGLAAIPNSTQPLSQAGGADPAQIQFHPTGRSLVVTEKATNQIVTYEVRNTKQPNAPVVSSSAGQTPFGFSFTSGGLLVVSEAVGGAAGQGLVSTYGIESNGAVIPVDPAVPDFQSAPCWIVITADGRFTYTTNTASNNISGYLIRSNGKLELLNSDGVAATSDAGPIDAALAGSDHYLYVLNAGAGSITAYSVGSDGSLTPIAGGASGLPAGTNGLAAM